LDLSKIESGMMAIEIGEVPFADVTEQMNRSFHQLAQDKGLEFTIDVEPNLPPSILTDQKRLQQVLKNLLSNAFKFTEKGRVSLQIKTIERRGYFGAESLNQSEVVVGFSVVDTGIGIPADKQAIIFETFQQADASTSRKYGGTGLGLSISREIARLLGGEIRVASVAGEGSTFTLYLPRSNKASAVASSQQSSLRANSSAALPAPLTSVSSFPMVEYNEVFEIADDRADIALGDRLVLIVEDDALFAQILLDLAHEKGFKGLVAARGDVALNLARKYKPDAITLDIKLPDQEGWTVLDRLKHDSETSHIPVHVITAYEQERQPRAFGAFMHLQKPVSREQLADAFDQITAFAERAVKRLLVVEDDDTQRMSIVELIGGGDVETTAVATAEEAIEALKAETFDCMVLDLKLPDMSGFDLIDKIQTELDRNDLPIIVYTGKDLTEKEESQLRQVADAIVVKEANSPERLLAETALFLHRVEARMPEPKRRMIQNVMRNDPVLAGKKVLIVDDDVRNIFALSSALESYQMEVLYAEDGREGVKLLQQNPGIDVVLMDIMMPEMDGYETMQAIRNIDTFASLPIIALTAKAMKADREKCIEAGASDYISKPLDIDQLLSMLRVWLYGRKAAQA
jgi:CheY-like chemotaxis protein/two-component sensor histidine kinase